MTQLGKLWAGRVYGTNAGNIFVEFDEVEPHVVGRLRFLDSLAGIAVYSVKGTFDDRLVLTGEWEQGGKLENHGTLTIEARLTSDGNLRGTWKSTVGTGGTFELLPHDVAIASDQRKPSQSGPEQLYTRKLTLGAVRLYANDVLALLKFMAEEFTAPRPVVAYRVRGNEVAKYAADFVQEFSAIGELDYLKITVQEPDAHGLNRLVVVELNASGSNELLVQGIRESWVVGRSEALASFLRTYQSNLVTTYKRFGLNINSVIFLAMLVLIPEIESLRDRVLFVVATVVLLGLLYQVHARFIPNTSVSLGEARANAFVRAWPTILSWLVAASASLVAALLYRWFTHGAL